MRSKLLKSRLTIIIIIIILNINCNYTSQWNNLRSYSIETNGALSSRTDENLKSKYVSNGVYTWLTLKRLCLGDVGSWIGKRELTIGITIAQGADGNTIIGKGVIPSENVEDYNCIQVRNKLIVDPFIFQKGNYTLTFDIVELPAKNAKLLSSIASNLLSSANLIATSKGDPIAKIGTSLFDTFIKPAIEEKSPQVHFKQDFYAYEMDYGKNDPNKYWQNEVFILLPREGVEYEVNGEKKTYEITISEYYLDKQSELRKGDYNNPKDNDPYYTNSPYVVFEVSSNKRGWGLSDKKVSEVLRQASDSVSMYPDRAQNDIKQILNTVSENYYSITEWTKTMLYAATNMLNLSLDAIVSKEDNTLKAEKITKALKSYNSFMKEYTDSKTNIQLYDDEKEALSRVKTKLDMISDDMLKSIKVEIEFKDIEIQKTEKELNNKITTLASPLVLKHINNTNKIPSEYTEYTKQKIIIIKNLSKEKAILQNIYYSIENNK